ncbi:CHRD domain-containing protein [Parafilimonas sp.]|uniref:CHRD domain-containing protein n=1 Tax=Parafilimonas sp. TaxID=1969739 RepID=UPI0039E608DE
MNKAKHRAGIVTYALIVLAIFAGFNACKKDDVEDYLFSFASSLDGTQAIPANSETGTGACYATYDSIKNQLAYTITWDGLTGTPSLINFQVPDGDTGYINIPVTNSFSSNGVSGYLTIDQQYEAALLNYTWYVNVSTAAYSDGEIRGQLLKPQK